VTPSGDCSSNVKQYAHGLLGESSPPILLDPMSNFFLAKILIIIGCMKDPCEFSGYAFVCKCKKNAKLVNRPKMSVFVKFYRKHG